MAKKRTQAAAGVATEGRSTKKRKAAEASTAKTKQIADDDEWQSEDELDGVWNGVSTSHLDISKRKVKPKQEDVEDMPLVAPGLRLWEGFANTVPDTDIAALAKVNADHEQSIKYGFTLQPLIVTEGPLAGRKVLVLQENKAFRFLDLPPEIRNMIYGYLFDQDKEISIRTYKPNGGERRPVSDSFRPGSYCTRHGLTWDKKTGKWLGQPASAFSLLRVSRTILQETASIAYSSNGFSFYGYPDASLFLDRIGSMRRFIRDVYLPKNHYGAGQARSMFTLLENATNLQHITISHSRVCRKTYDWYARIGPESLAKLVKPLFKALQKAKRRLRADDETGQPELPQIMMVDIDQEEARCGPCKKGQPESCHGWDGCECKCADRRAHSDQLGKEIRNALKKAMKT